MSNFHIFCSYEKHVLSQPAKPQDSHFEFKSHIFDEVQFTPVFCELLSFCPFSFAHIFCPSIYGV